MSKEKIVYVDWVDSFTTARWATAQDVKEVKPCIASSIGFVVHENRNFITLAGSTDNEGMSNNRITIPKVAIKKRRTVKGVG